MILDTLLDDAPNATPIVPLGPEALDGWLETQSEARRAWVRNLRFTGAAGKFALVPGEAGTIAAVLAGTGPAGKNGEPADPWRFAGLPTSLPEATYAFEGLQDEREATLAALGWALGAYRFDRYKSSDKSLAKLVWPAAADRDAAGRAARAIELVRDLVNTPAEDMGPEQLEAAARELAKAHKAKCSAVVGDALLRKNYPAIHAVGRASAEAPRLIDLVWGEEDAPKLTLVGKGVCFDSGGLDLKPASVMKIMKKDMGGAAHALGLASMVMEAGLPVRLRVLIPAVENAVSGNALRPLDVIKTRAGKTVEIGHTDAEGRVVLADALAEAAGEAPDLIVDFATLTGAARVALGPELPAMFCNDDGFAAALEAEAGAEIDPLWRLPLWAPYRKMIEGKTADITNSAESPFAGAITAALFLQEFVGEVAAWVHFDVYAWNASSRPGRPEGGEAMAIRAVFTALQARYGA